MAFYLLQFVTVTFRGQLTEILVSLTSLELKAVKTCQSHLFPEKT